MGPENQDFASPIAVAFTGGPGGGKSELLKAVAGDKELRPLTAMLEEAIHGMRFVRLDPRTREFQCALVAIQAGTEDALKKALYGTEKRLLLTHRGTLDPCAFWQSFGNSRESFFEMTGTTLEDHCRRYDMVIHLESAALRVPEAYTRWPAAHRPEEVAQAARLDELLGDLWRHHPRYIRVPGVRDFSQKIQSAVEHIRRLVRSP